VFDNAWQEQRRRLTALENIWDDNTFRHIDAIGPMDGWRCLEVGAGAGSVASWLCDRVGTGGRVVATDLDTRFLEAITAPNLEVRRHDLVLDDLETEAFDLVHARLLLEHLTQSDVALRKLVAALKPGGWLVVEEFDHITFLADPEADAADQAVWDAWSAAFAALSQQRGLDLIYGRRLFSLLRRQGLHDVRAEGQTVMESGGDESRALLRLSLIQIRDTLTGTGRIDDRQMDRLLDLLQAPSFAWMSQVMVTARGRKG
jgi:SAM-dependent methyltransferase